jgi:PAS domain-containing protein
MAKLSPTHVGTEQQVTASDLVRHFGIWQDRATRAPVYILHRGRPRLVLTSLDVMDALCAPHSGKPADDGQLAAALDVFEDIVVVLNADRYILAASRGARSYFGEAVRPGATLAGLAAQGDDSLMATVSRVASSGLSETIECRSPRFANRLLSYTVDCGTGGCIIQVRDATAAEEMQHWRDRHESAFKAIEAAGGACAIVNLRGRIDQASAGLASLSGASIDALTSARLVSLVAVGDRSTLGDAFEAAIDQRVPQSLTASLLVGGAALRPVTVGLAPLASAGHVTGVTVIIAPLAS